MTSDGEILRAYRVWEDQSGLIWFGSAKGLHRYDGHAVEWFALKGEKISSMDVHQILEDGEGWLWLITYARVLERRRVNQIVCFDPQSKQFQGLQERLKGRVSVSTDHIYSLTGDHHGNISIGTKTGKIIQIFQDFSTRSTQIPNAEQLTVSSMGENGALFIQAENAYLLDKEGKLYEYDTPSQIVPIHLTEEGKLWVYCPESEEKNFQYIYELTPKETIKVLHKIPRHHYPGANKWFFIIRKQKTIWFLDRKQNYVFDPSQNSIFDFDQHKSDINLKRVNEPYFDRTGKAWLPVVDGIYLVRLRSNRFRTYPMQVFSKLEKEQKIISTGLIEMDGKVYVNCILPSRKRETRVLNLKSNITETLKASPQSGGKAETFQAKGSIRRYQNQLLFGIKNFLRVYDPAANTFFDVYTKEPSIGRIIEIYVDPLGEVWVGTDLGQLYTWNRDEGKLIPHPLWQWNSAPGKKIIYTLENWSKHELLVGTILGLYLFNHQTGEIEHFGKEEEGENYIPCNQIYDVYVDRDKYVWLAQPYCGLTRLDLLGRDSTQAIQSRLYTMADGLSSSFLFSILEDKEEQLWISGYGLSVLDKGQNTMRTFLKNDGLSSSNLTQYGYFQGVEGHIYYGSEDGITIFHPDDLKPAYPQKTNFQVTSLKQFDATKGELIDQTKTLKQESKIYLPPGDRYFSLSFALLAYLREGLVRYSYWLEGLDNSWRLLEGNTLQLDGLEYGNYVLHIRAEDSSGQFATHEVSFDLIVARPFYLQNWFALLCTVLFLSLLLGFIRYKNHRANKVRIQLEHIVKERTATILAQNKVMSKQAEQLQQLDELKSRFFANISHDLRSPLSIILGTVKSIINSKALNNKNLTLATLTHQSASQLLRLVEEILDISKLDSNKIKVEEDTLNLYQTIRYIIAPFESVAQSKNIQFEFYSEIDKYLTIKIDRKKFEKILTNILSNAFKFTPNEGKVVIEIQDLGNKIRLKIQDNGSGIHPDDLPYIFNRFYQSTQPGAPLAGGSGLGLALSMELAKLMDSKLWAESTIDVGSSFYLEFLKKEVLSRESSDLSLQDTPEQTDLLSLSSSLADHKIASPISPNIAASNGSDKLSPSQSQKFHILIVEDNHSLRTYLEIILKESYNISLAENGKVALDILEGKVMKNSISNHGDQPFLLPDLILTDMMMPEMDGYQLLNKLKKHPKYRHIPVITLTAKADISDQLKALRIGVDDYILKPFDEQQLLLRIGNILQNLQERKLVWKHNHQVNAHSQDMINNGDQAIKKVEESTSEEGISEEDLVWLGQTEGMIKKHLGKFDFSVEELAELLATNRWQLNNRIKTCTGLTARQYILEVRINHARYLLETKKTKSVKHTVYEVGMKDIKYFSKQFKKRFGKSPSAYL